MSGDIPEKDQKSKACVRLGSFDFLLSANELRDGAGEAVHLRSQSTEVLAYLARRPGQVVPKQELIDRIWTDVFVTDDSLGQCITDIRKALGDADHRIIRTFPKKGYMLDANAGGALRVAAVDVGGSAGERAKPRLSGLSILLAVLLISLAGWGIWRQDQPQVGSVGQNSQYNLNEPSIVVLPFKNMTEDDDLNYLAEGFSTGVRTQLAKFPQISVIAGATALKFRDGPGTARGIGRELRVRYVLDGSVGQIDGRHIVNAELIEAETEKTIWAHQYDFSFEEVIPLQADLVEEITGTLNVVIGEKELAAARLHPTNSPQAYELFLRSELSTGLLTAAGRGKAIMLLEEAIALDPDFLAAHFELSGRYLSLWRFGGTDDPLVALKRARFHADRAMQISQADYRGHFRLGMLHLFADHDHDLAYAAFRRAIETNPNDTDVLYNMGFLRSLMGKPDEAIDWNNRAKRVNPRYPGWYNFNAALSHYFIKDYEQALILARSGIAAYPNSLAPRRILIATLVEMGRQSEAQNEVREFLELDPNFQLSTFRNTPFQNRADENRYFGAMIAAGIPE